MEFCTAINCIDGRTQQPVLDYMRKRFDATYVDTITEPGPNLILAENTNTTKIESILQRLDISVNKHHSSVIAIVGHWDCAANLADEETQNQHTAQAVKFIQQKFPNTEVIGLWVDQTWTVTELKPD